MKKLTIGLARASLRICSALRVLETGGLSGLGKWCREALSVLG